MSRQLRQRHLSGVSTTEVRDYEVRHRALAREAAAKGMVLLRNDNDILPLKSGASVALYGSGALHFTKGGTGSGDVNQRECIAIADGMRSAGFVISNEEWLTAYEKVYQEERLKWRDWLIAKNKEPGNPGMFELYAGNPMPCPVGPDPEATGADTAIYILSRTSGEGADRKNAPGDYLLTDDEYAFIGKMCNVYEHVVLVINAGGLIDLSFTDDYANVESILYMSQPGMEGGNALADVLSGKIVPSAKLTDSWAYAYEDYPGAKEFSTNGATLEYAAYHEGIYVGYRYFDSFHKAVRYGFGFGLSYTKFEITTQDVQVFGQGSSEPYVSVRVNVKNTGDKYTGREVVQIYISCPDGRLEKEFRRLVAFAKTDEIAPGMSQDMCIDFPLDQCTSYCEEDPGFLLEEGYYGIWIGSSLGESKLRAMLKLDNGIYVEKTENICPVKKDFSELHTDNANRITRYKSWVEKGKTNDIPVVNITDAFGVSKSVKYGVDNMTDPEALRVAEGLNIDELIRMTTGEPSLAEMATEDPSRAGKDSNGQIGGSGLSVPGSAAETSTACVKYGIGSMVLSDGPAGLRLDQKYYVSPDNKIHQRSFMEKVEDGLFMEREPEVNENDTTYYQYCTAFPVGISLAQSWDPELVEKVGEAVSDEMMEFQTSLWLAPGMNIHRNPLCGRNFEYYSEDPVLTGIMASAMTRGVQSKGGCGTTIKHFACNNQEANRMHCDSMVHERALREIYLKGFEMCVKSSQPMAVMTSYNLVNAVHTANSYDLCTKVLRDEWGFKGIIMTDWTTTEHGDDCTASGCLRAGNDLVCPGNPKDHENIRAELKNGTLTRKDINLCVARLIKTVWQSNAYLDVPPYTEQFYNTLRNYISVSLGDVQ
ncbi:MAG: glycoside hydrolase family 3 C-terminal domain-containing protein [Lachnospiraceae bacterium]|nr:glycoside hydrolase family 3 C-terminal domain-containing protein [Lachnospiraceae bacterium]